MWVQQGVVKKTRCTKKPLNFQGLLLCAFGALLEVEQPLRLHPTGITQACDVDPCR